MADETDATPENITQELYKRNAELALKNKTLSLLSKLYEISILTLEPLPLAERITETIQTELDFDLVGIFNYDDEADELTSLKFTESKRLSEALGENRPTFDSLKIGQGSKHQFFGPIITSTTPNSTENLADIWDALIPAPKLEAVKEQGHLKSVLVYPLVAGDHRALGLLAIGLNRPYQSLGEFETESIKSFVDVIAIALDKARLYQELQITNQKLAAANARLKELDRQKTEFVSMASHQLRSPLTAIKGYSSMLLEGSFGEITEKPRDAVDVIFQSSQRLVNIIEDFLNISRIELGTMRYEMSDFDLKELAEKVVTELRPNIEKKGLTLTLEEDGGPYRVHGDVGKLSQVIGNLIDNSAKYTLRGAITVRVENKDGAVRFTVSDTGVGIAPETMPKLFQKFIRADDAGKTNILGTGLGLYVARQIIEGHQGKIWAESPGAGQGSRFIFELPAHPA